MSSVFVVPVLTPHGHLILSEDRDASALEPELARRLQNAFARGSGHGLLQLGASEVGVALPPAFSYWREFGARYVTALCTRPYGEARSTTTHDPASYPRVRRAFTGKAPCSALSSWKLTTSGSALANQAKRLSSR